MSAIAPRTESLEPAEGATIASDSATTLFLKILVYAAGFVASVLISRGLGPEGRGVYYLPVVASATLATLANLGLEQANVYLFGTRRIPVARLWGQSTLVAIVAGISGAVLLIQLPRIAGLFPEWTLLPRMFDETPRVLLWLAALALPFTLHSLFAAGLLTLIGQVTWQFKVALASAVLQFLLLLALFFTPVFTPAVVLAVALVCAVFTWFLNTRRLGAIASWRPAWDPGLLAASLRQSLVLHAGTVFLFLHLRADMFMVQALNGATALGEYSLAVVLAETVLLATDSLALALLPRQVGNTLEESALLALRGVRFNLLLGAGLAALWAVVGWPFIVVAFGRSFEMSYLPLLALLPAMVFIGTQRVCGGPALRTGRPAYVAAINALSLVCNVLLNLWWIPKFGLVGAALASSVSYGLSAFLFIAWICRLADARIRQHIVPRRADIEVLWAHGMSTAASLFGRGRVW